MIVRLPAQLQMLKAQMFKTQVLGQEVHNKENLLVD